MTDTEKLSRAIRYLADSDACLRVQFNDRDKCRAAETCEACWEKELGRENANK